MIFGMGPPDSRLNRKVMPRKNLAIDIVHLFRPNTLKLLRNHLKKRGSASTSAHQWALAGAPMTDVRLHHTLASLPVVDRSKSQIRIWLGVPPEARRHRPDGAHPL
jgi:hypothetical protein